MSLAIFFWLMFYITMKVSFLGKLPSVKLIQPSVHDAIRQHILGEAMPYDEFHRQGRLGEFELKKLGDDLIKPSTVQHELLKDLNINAFNQVQENGYVGQALIYHKQTEKCLEQLKKAGINQVIDAVLDPESGYKEACEEAGLTYHRFALPDDFWREKRHLEFDPQYFVNQIVNFIKQIQKGNFYLGCGCGTERTIQALALSHFLNPQDCQFTYQEPREICLMINVLPKIHKELTPAHKKKMGWTPEFEEKFKARIQKALDD